MSVLLVDIGNTRIKWSVLRGDRMGRQKALEHAGITPRDLERQLFARTRGITRVIAASVAGTRLNRLLARDCPPQDRSAHASSSPPPAMPRASRTRYKEPWRLGRRPVHGGDRGLSHGPGARGLRHRPRHGHDHRSGRCAGRASGRGHHSGAGTDGRAACSRTPPASPGAPAAHSRTRAFSRRTHALRSARVRGMPRPPSSIAPSPRRSGSLQRTPLVLLTGGAAVQIESLLQCSYVSVPDLVLRGVALRCGLPHQVNHAHPRSSSWCLPIWHSRPGRC